MATPYEVRVHAAECGAFNHPRKTELDEDGAITIWTCTADQDFEFVQLIRSHPVRTLGDRYAS